VFRTVATLGTLVAGGGAIALFTGQLRRLDEVAKTAGRLNTTTEALSRLQFAGEQTGVAVTTMNMALQRMNRRVAEAAQGAGEAKAAIADDLGLDATKLAAMGVTEQFRAITAAFKENVPAADRTRVAMKLFDSEGVALINTMLGGTEALDEFAATSDRLGNTIDSKTAKAAERFNDSMNRLKASIGGVVAGLADAFVPTLQRVSDAIEGTISSLRTMDQVALKNKLQVAALVAGFTAGIALAPKIIGVVMNIVTALKALAKAQALTLALGGPKAWIQLAAGVAAGAAAVVAIEAAFSQLNTTVEATPENVAEVTEKVDEVAKLSEKIMGSFRGGSSHPVAQVIETISDGIRQATDAMADMERRAASIFDATRTPAERLAMKLNEIKELSATGFLDPETAARAINQLRQQQNDAISGMASDDAPATREVSFAALGARDAAGRKQDKIEKNTADEVAESKKQTATLADLLKLQTNSQGAAITTVNF